jgi:hypothetical protein
MIKNKRRMKRRTVTRHRIGWRKPRSSSRVGRKRITKRSSPGRSRGRKVVKRSPRYLGRKRVQRVRRKIAYRGRGGRQPIRRVVNPPPQPHVVNPPPQPHVVNPPPQPHVVNPPPQPLSGIENYGNTCYHNAAVKLLKNIPGLIFNTMAFDRVYRTPEDKISEPMVRGVVDQCHFRWREQNDAAEMIMLMLSDVVNRGSFEIPWELEHYIMYIKDCLPLYNGITHRIRSTQRPDRAYQYRLSNVENRVYTKIQEMMNVLQFSAGGPGENEIQTDFNDPEFSPAIDYVWKNGSKTPLRELMMEAGSSKLPTCKREVYTPGSEYLIVTLDTIDFSTGTKKTNLRITDMDAPIRFPNGFSYTPVSMVCHLGSTISSGHYMNYTMENNGTWTLYDDSRVLRGLDANAIQGVPYVMLFRKMEKYP